MIHLYHLNFTETDLFYVRDGSTDSHGHGIPYSKRSDEAATSTGGITFPNCIQRCLSDSQCRYLTSCPGTDWGPECWKIPDGQIKVESRCSSSVKLGKFDFYNYMYTTNSAFNILLSVFPLSAMDSDIKAKKNNH